MFLHVSTSNLALRSKLVCTLIYNMPVIALKVTVVSLKVTVTVKVTVDDCGLTFGYAL